MTLMTTLQLKSLSPARAASGGYRVYRANFRVVDGPATDRGRPVEVELPPAALRTWDDLDRHIRQHLGPWYSVIPSLPGTIKGLPEGFLPPGHTDATPTPATAGQGQADAGGGVWWQAPARVGEPVTFAGPVEVGHGFYLAPTVLGEPVRLRVAALEAGRARVRREGSDGPGTWVPVDSFGAWLDELRGRVPVPPNATDPALQALREGRARLLGRGDEGLSFRAGDEVVKAGGVARLRPFDGDARSVAEAAANLRAMHARTEGLRAGGVPGVLPSRLIEGGGAAFLARPFVEVPARLTPEQVDQAARTLDALHARGLALHDRPQVGVARDGQAVHYDLSKAGPARDGEQEADRRALARLASACGVGI